jgi:hypothetical protein
MEYIQLDVFNKYLDIKKDLMDNISEVYNRKHYYTHKYRGTRDLDLHVGVGNNLIDPSKKEIQIFLRFKKYYIKDNIIYDGMNYFKSIIKTNLNE